jgi:hypothetical protein
LKQTRITTYKYKLNNNKRKIMQELLDQIQEELVAIQEDAAKFNEKGNKAAGTRVRKAMQAIKGLAQDVRVAVSAANKA